MRCKVARVDPSADTVQLEATASSLSKMWWPAQQAVMLERAPIDTEHLPGANARVVAAARIKGRQSRGAGELDPASRAEREAIRKAREKSSRSGKRRARQVRELLDQATAVGRGGPSTRRSSKRAWQLQTAAQQ